MGPTVRSASREASSPALPGESPHIAHQAVGWLRSFFSSSSTTIISCCTTILLSAASQSNDAESTQFTELSRPPVGKQEPAGAKIETYTPGTVNIESGQRTGRTPAQERPRSTTGIPLPAGRHRARFEGLPTDRLRRDRCFRTARSARRLPPPPPFQTVDDSTAPARFALCGTPQAFEPIYPAIRGHLDEAEIGLPDTAPTRCRPPVRVRRRRGGGAAGVRSGSRRTGRGEREVEPAKGATAPGRAAVGLAGLGRR
jgi:hypothetical protein